MSDRSAIEWTDATWNPTVGCSIVSKGCTNCYAMQMAARLEAMGQPIYRGMTKPSKAGPVWTGKVELSNWGQVIKPLSWRRPRRIFVNSMSDLFHEALPDEAIDQVFAVMLTSQAQHHTFQILTKRPARMQAYMRGLIDQRASRDRLLPIIRKMVGNPCGWFEPRWSHLPDHIWLGVSVEDQATADARIPILLETPARVRFISAEPLLGAVDLHHLRAPDGLHASALQGQHDDNFYTFDAKLDWVIAGGESGPDARPAHPDWFRALRDQCAAAGVPYFFKQWGEWTPGENVERQTGTVEVARRFDDRWRFGRENLARDDGHFDDQPDVYRIGKKAAGALLDGREHREFPR